MEQLLGLYEICTGFELLNGTITQGQHDYRIRKARRLANIARSQREHFKGTESNAQS